MFKEFKEEYNKYNVNNGEYFITVLMSLILTFLIISAPIAIFINLMIYNHLIKLFIFLIALTIQIGISIFFKLYLNGISKGKMNNINKYTISFSILTFFISIIVLLFIFLII